MGDSIVDFQYRFWRVCELQLVVRAKDCQELQRVRALESLIREANISLAAQSVALHYGERSLRAGGGLSAPKSSYTAVRAY